MENKGKINITRHAVIRYAQRCYSGQIITDRTYDQWRANNEESVKFIERLIQKEYGEAEFVTCASYDKHRKAEFYLNEKKMMTYIVAEGNIVTCYKIDFELDEEGNKAIYKGFKEALLRALREEERWDLTAGVKILDFNNQIKVKNAEIEELEAKMNKIKAEKRFLEAEIEKLSAEGKEIKSRINSIREKIVRSKKAI